MKYYFCFKTKCCSKNEISQLTLKNPVNIWQLSLPGNVWHFSKCSKTVHWLSLWKKKKENLTLLSFLLVKLHQYLNYTVLVIRVGFGTWVFLLEPRTIITRAEDVAGWQQGPPVRRGAVLGFQGDIDVLWTNDQSHLELPGIKSTFTYLSLEGGFGKAVVEHKQTKLIRWQLILDLKILGAGCSHVLGSCLCRR